MDFDTLVIGAAVAIPLLGVGMIVIGWINDRRADLILRKLDDN